jgi:hypothetical protein
MQTRNLFVWIITAVVLLALVGPSLAQDEVVADLDAIKAFALDNAASMKAGTEGFLAAAEAYYAVIEAAGFDYAAAWADSQDDLTAILDEAKAQWLIASSYYETDEGIVAGVPSLAYYDTWIDAGPPAAEDPEEAIEWTLTLPDGTTLESPGNFFHNLTEPALWGTNPDFVGLAVDLDGDGTVAVGEVLPEANILLGSAQGLDAATAEMITAIEAWEPTLEDAFTAMVVMVPTMSEYFEQWKESVFISASSEEQSFIAVSRLFDINGILAGLDVAYDQVGPLVAAENPELHAQIDVGFNQLINYVSDLFEQEQAGTVFTPEEADLFGSEAQSRAEALAALISQSADELTITLELE